MSTVVVTGAGGYIGGRLVGTLIHAGEDVRAVVREPSSVLDVPQTACELAEPGAKETLLELFRGADAVIHLAGETEVLAAREPARVLAETVVATENVSEACAAAGVRRLVYLSTVHVYGARMVPGATLSEDLRAEPRSAYAISRLACEHVAASLTTGAYELVTLRLTNSVGAPVDPHVDRWSLVANDLSRQGATTGRLELNSSGTQWRDFVPLDHVCRAISTAAAGQLSAGTFNVASGHPITVRALAQMVQDAFERQTGTRPALVAPAPESDPPGPYHVSIDRLASYGLKAENRLEAAVEETVRFCLDHREEL